MPAVGLYRLKSRWSQLFLAFLVQIVLSPESLNPSTGVNQLLLTGEKWVAIRADFYSNILFG